MKWLEPAELIACKPTTHAAQAGAGSSASRRPGNRWERRAGGQRLRSEPLRGWRELGGELV